MKLLRFSVFLMRLVVAAGPDFALAAAFLITWTKPETFGGQSVYHFTFLMLMEFLVIHSSGFLGAVASRRVRAGHRVLQFSILCLFYGAIVTVFSLGFGSGWPAVAFIALLLSKFPTVVLHPPDEKRLAHVMLWWVGMTMLFLTGAVLMAFPLIPALGVTPEVIARQDFFGEGIVVEEPYRVLFFGAFYFTGLGILALIYETHRCRGGKTLAPNVD